MTAQEIKFKELKHCLESDTIVAAKLLALAWQDYYDALSEVQQRRVELVCEQLCVPNTELVNASGLFSNDVLVGAHACYPGDKIEGLFQGSNLHFMRLQTPSERKEFQSFLKRSGTGRPAIPSESYYISRFAVSQSHRASATAEQLLKDVTTVALASDHTLLSLHVATDNGRAVGFYKRKGFTIAAEHGGFFSMELRLTAGNPNQC